MKGRTRRQINENGVRIAKIEGFMPDSSAIYTKVMRCLTILGVDIPGHLVGVSMEKELAAQAEAETDHAIAEIARVWMDSLLAAWYLFLSDPKPESGIILDAEDFLPDFDRDENLTDQWPEAFTEGWTSLQNSVALSRNDFNGVFYSFCANLKKALEEGPVEIPDELQIVKDGEDYYLRVREEA